MKRFSTFFVLAALLVFTLSASAVEFDKNNLEFVGGVTYNTFDFTEEKDGNEVKMDSDMKDDLENGFGFYGGALYWLNDELAVGAGVDYATSSFDDEKKDLDVTNKLVGPYAGVVYRLNDMFSLNGGVAYYSFDYKNEDKDNEWKKEGNGLGLLLGGQFTYDLKDNLALKADANYRLANLDIDEIDDKDVEDRELDLSGLRLAVGLSYDF